MKKIWVIIGISFVIYHCHNPHNISQNNHLDTLWVGYGGYNITPTILVSQVLYDVTQDTVVGRNRIKILFLGKKNDSTYCAILYNPELFEFPYKEFVQKFENDSANFIRHYKQKGFTIYYNFEEEDPLRYIMFNEKDTLIQEANYAMFSINDTLIKSNPYFKVGDSSEKVLDKLGLKDKIKTIPSTFVLIINTSEMIEDKKYRAFVEKKNMTYKYSTTPFQLYFEKDTLSMITNGDEINDLTCSFAYDPRFKFIGDERLRHILKNIKKIPYFKQL